MYQHGLGTAIFADQAAERVYREYVILTGFELFFQALEDTYRSLDYLHSLSQISLGEFPEFLHSKLQRKNELRAEKSQTLWNIVINM